MWSLLKALALALLVLLEMRLKENCRMNPCPSPMVILWHPLRHLIYMFSRIDLVILFLLMPFSGVTYANKF